MKIIVSVDLNWGIGGEGELLERIPEDMKRFRRITTGNVIVMGRKTLETLPHKSPLKNRVNIVLTRNDDFEDDRLIVCNSVYEAMKVFKQYHDKEIYIIGGETIYKQFLPYCEQALITKFKKEYDNADKHIPNLDEDENWEITDISKTYEYNGTEYTYVTYKNNNVGSESN